VTRTLPESFDAALDAWAEKVASQYEKYGLPEGDKPEAWCNETLLESLDDDVDVMSALLELASARFKAACAKRGHK
jgi:hypothetical protein